MSTTMRTDVAIVGFGPTGATLAGLLAKRGISVTVIEKSADVYPQPRAAHIDHTGLRTIQEIGCLDAVLPPMIRNQSLDLVNRDHELLLRVPAGQDSVSGLPTSVYFYQPSFDRTLRDAVSAMDGVTVKLGTEFLSLQESEDGVAVTVRNPDGTVGTLRAGWLVGCDGAWSPVREMMGSPLESLNFDECWLVLDLKLRQPQPNLPADRVVQVCDPRRPHLTTPISADRQRFEFMLLPGEEPEASLQPAHVEKLLSEWLPPESYEIERRANYTFHGLIAREWRRGRVIIAGDAAHQMPPFLGQGMCSGLRDASNLAWKLAAVVNGKAPADLLDTYMDERSPHVRTVIEAAIGFGRLVCVTDPGLAAERDRRLRSEGQSTSERASFTLPRLQPGPLVLAGGGSLFVQPVIDANRLDDVVGERFLVVAKDRAALGTTAAWWRDRVGAYVTTEVDIGSEEISRWMSRYDAKVVVVRPDRYVLGTADVLDDITRSVKGLLDAPPEGAAGVAVALPDHLPAHAK